MFKTKASIYKQESNSKKLPALLLGFKFTDTINEIFQTVFHMSPLTLHFYSGGLEIYFIKVKKVVLTKDSECSALMCYCKKADKHHTPH